MADYAKMYYILCAAASEALDALPETTENTKRNTGSFRFFLETLRLVW